MRWVQLERAGLIDAEKDGEGIKGVEDQEMLMDIMEARERIEGTQVRFKPLKNENPIIRGDGVRVWMEYMSVILTLALEACIRAQSGRCGSMNYIVQGRGRSRAPITSHLNKWKFAEQ